MFAVGAVLALGSAAPAGADEPETDQLWISAPYDLVLPTADADGSATTNTVDVKLGHDNRTADRTLLTLFASHGLAFSQRFGNCAYLDADPVTNQSGTTAVCVLDEPVVPGQVYDLAAAGAVRATSAALYERGRRQAPAPLSRA
ncbi:hypothetical protein ACFRCI_10170 [Streptomyces sp. NPDC056638]|uniref:hypothetical protein n=1 Tax=Streptomyces sp. NPDC056638 TaxID=3345887 RepID=UPI0036821E94